MNNKENRCVVRLTTSTWMNDRGLHTKRSLNFLHRRSTGWNWLKEDINAIGADEVIKKITNLATCKDGVYKIIHCNQYHDWETGYIEDYDFKLIPIENEISTHDSYPNQ